MRLVDQWFSVTFVATGFTSSALHIFRHLKNLKRLLSVLIAKSDAFHLKCSGQYYFQYESSNNKLC